MLANQIRSDSEAVRMLHFTTCSRPSHPWFYFTLPSPLNGEPWQLALNASSREALRSLLLGRSFWRIKDWGFKEACRQYKISADAQNL